jgi:hypothetical protein
MEKDHGNLTGSALSPSKAIAIHVAWLGHGCTVPLTSRNVNAADSFAYGMRP